MSVNRHLPHVLVLPEDDANRQLANGFLLTVSTRQIQVLPVAGGWRAVLDSFLSEHVSAMERIPLRFLVLLIDFDCSSERLDQVKKQIPEKLTQRVFVVGAWSEPEELKRALGAYEEVGSKLAHECRDGTDETWTHVLLRHNASELVRLRDSVRPILFDTA